MSERIYDIAVIAGDGIGREVMPEGIRALEAASRRHGFTRAIETVLREPKLRTRDLGGAADTQTCGKAIAELLS
jgi:isocitrate/isopropylmalate dehydrogenase